MFSIWVYNYGILASFILGENEVIVGGAHFWRRLFSAD
jgi:hypothetical protein